MKFEDREKLERRIIKILKNNEWISTTELSIRSKINYYRLKMILSGMKRKKMLKSKKGNDKRGSIYWSVRSA